VDTFVHDGKAVDEGGDDEMTAMPITEIAAKTGWDFAEGEEIVPGRLVHRLLGGGWHYEAYVAFDDALHYPVVVKALRPDRVADPSALRGLLREAEILGSISHPVIARLLDAELAGERPHLVLELVEGPRLSTLIRRFGPLAIDQVVPLAAELGSALHYLHGRGLVHLDVKPKNVIMAGPPRLIDFSIARTVERAAATNMPLGTNAYMAPEQCDPQGGAPMQPASDVWGLGATLHEAISGEPPFGRGSEDPDATPEERWPQLVREPEPLPRDVPAALSATVNAFLERRPEDRPTAAAVVAALEPMLRRPRRLVLNRLRPR
jgi:serine/threonine-protein kinase